MLLARPPTIQKLRLVLADDHDLVREGLRRTIDKEHDMEVIAEAKDGEAALRLVTELRPAILLVDLSMPGMTGIEVTRAVCTASVDVRVIGVTRNRESRSVAAMMSAGAVGYVLKQSASDELLRAIRSVAAGDRYIDRALPQSGIENGAAVQSGPDAVSTDTSALDDTEKNVLGLVATAHSDREIAHRLSMTIGEVRAAKHQAMQRAGLRSRGQVIEYLRTRRVAGERAGSVDGAPSTPQGESDPSD